MGENENTEVGFEGLDEAWENEELDFSQTEVPATKSGEPENGTESQAASGEAGQDQSGEPEDARREPESAGGADHDAGAEPQDQRFTLKHMDETREVSREEAVALAQKGLDYDRISGELDGFKALGRYETVRDALGEIKELGGLEAVREYKAFLEELAAEGGQTVQDTIDATRASLLAKRENIDRGVALERVKLQRRERALQKREDDLKAAETAGKRDSDAEAKRREDFTAFVKAYPGVNATDIPAEVWASVRDGESLVSAYGRHELTRLREENRKLTQERDALKLGEKNRERSAGSQQSTGQGRKQEAWEQAWYDDDY